MHQDQYIIIITCISFKKLHVYLHLYPIYIDHLQRARQFMRLAKFIQ